MVIANLLNSLKLMMDHVERLWRHDNPQSSVLFNVAVAEQCSPFYGNLQHIPLRKTWAGKSVAVLGSNEMDTSPQRLQ